MSNPQPNIAIQFLSSAFGGLKKAADTIDDGISIAHRETKYQNKKNSITNNRAIHQLLEANSLTLEDLPSLDDWMQY